MPLHIPFSYLQLLQYILGYLNISLLSIDIFEGLVHSPLILDDAIDNPNSYSGAPILLRHDETGGVAIDSFFDEIKEFDHKVDVVQFVHLMFRPFSHREVFDLANLL